MRKICKEYLCISIFRPRCKLPAPVMAFPFAGISFFVRLMEHVGDDEAFRSVACQVARPSHGRPQRRCSRSGLRIGTLPPPPAIRHNLFSKGSIIHGNVAPRLYYFINLCEMPIRRGRWIYGGDNIASIITRVLKNCP